MVGRDNSEIEVGGRTSASPAGEGSGRGAHLKASGTTWSTPGRCSITKSNSAIDRHQHESFDCCGAIEVKNLRLAWSVITVIFRPKT